MISFLRVSHPLSVRPLVGQTRQPSRTTEKIMYIIKAKSNFTLLSYILFMGIGEWYFKCV